VMNQSHAWRIPAPASDAAACTSMGWDGPHGLFQSNGVTMAKACGAARKEDIPLRRVAGCFGGLVGRRGRRPGNAGPSGQSTAARAPRASAAGTCCERNSTDGPGPRERSARQHLMNEHT
jgi:hypothetical protein